MQNTDTLHEFLQIRLNSVLNALLEIHIKDMKILEEYSSLTSENKPFKYSNK